MSRNPRVSRRTFLGASGTALAAVSLGATGTANAATPSSPNPAHRPTPEQPFGPVTVYAPPAGGTLYARAVRLTHQRDGHAAGSRPATLLATFSQFGSGPMPAFPIFRSDDGGHTWYQQSSVRDTVNGWGLPAQPFLYELPRPFAGLPRGTILCAGNSIPPDRSQTKIDLYASTDRGLTWRFVSSVCRGGAADPTNGQTPVWEPFLLLHRNRLICYYSDQRDPKYGQKLAHQTSPDLVHWGRVVNDAVGTTYDQRPGMTTVAQLPLGKWIMTYELGNNPDGRDYAVHYRIADDPESFDSAPAILLHDQDGYIPAAGPTVSWSPSGGRYGTIIVSPTDDQDLFVNRAMGDPGAWTRSPSVVPGGYTRHTIPLENGLVFVITGGSFGHISTNTVQCGVDRLR